MPHEKKVYVSTEYQMLFRGIEVIKNKLSWALSPDSFTEFTLEKYDSSSKKYCVKSYKDDNNFVKLSGNGKPLKFKLEDGKIRLPSG